MIGACMRYATRLPSGYSSNALETTAFLSFNNDNDNEVSCACNNLQLQLSISVNSNIYDISIK